MRDDRQELRPSRAEGSTDAADAIEFSVVIPAYNRPRELQQCLEALATLDHPKDRHEVIVVDDGSEESIEPAVVPFLDRMNLTLLRQSNAGPASARNAGAAAARGRYVAFTDDDCRPDPAWLDALSRSLAAKPDCAVGGRTINGLPQRIYSSASQLLLEYVYTYLNRSADEAFFFASNNVAFPRRRFIDVGGFDVRFPLAAAEDRELCDRWRWLGERMIYAPDATIRHHHALSLRTFLTQHFNYGRGASIFRAIRRGRSTRVAPAGGGSFYLGLLRAPFAGGVDRRASLTLLLVLSQIVMVAGSVWQSLSQRRSAELPSSPDGAEAGAIHVVVRGASDSRPAR